MPDHTRHRASTASICQPRSLRIIPVHLRFLGRPQLLTRISHLPRPTVSPAKNSLVYFISMAYIDHPVWRRPREEAKRGPPSGHRITRNGAAMVSLLLPYATTGVSRIAGWCVIGVTPRGQPRTPVLCTFHRPFMDRPVPRQLMRNELLDLTTIVPATAYHRRSYAKRYSRFTFRPKMSHRGATHRRSPHPGERMSVCSQWRVGLARGGGFW
jgi:hypothetical protein